MTGYESRGVQLGLQANLPEICGSAVIRCAEVTTIGPSKEVIKVYLHRSDMQYALRCVSGVQQPQAWLPKCSALDRARLYYFQESLFEYAFKITMRRTLCTASKDGGKRSLMLRR